MRVVCCLLIAIFTALPVMAQQSPEFPRKARFIVQLTSSQYASGLGEYLAPPLEKAFLRAGLAYSARRPAYAATVENEYDVGKWYEAGGRRVWLYTRDVTVGLSPADADIDNMGKLEPWFSVTARIVTPDADRVDELNCLVSLATRELAARYRLRGHVIVDGKSCARD